MAVVKTGAKLCRDLHSKRMTGKLLQISVRGTVTRHKEKHFFPEGAEHWDRLGIPIPGDTQSLIENSLSLTLVLVSPVLSRRVNCMASSHLFQLKLSYVSFLFGGHSQASQCLFLGLDLQGRLSCLIAI